MRIVEIRDAVAPISSPIRNAFIDFSKMTISVIAIVTDVMRDGERVGIPVTTRRESITDEFGNKSDIELVPLPNLRSFYRKYYQPDNALLIIAGQFDKAKALDYTKQHFGAIPAPTRTLDKTYTIEPPQDGERSVKLQRTGEVAIAGLVYHVPASAHEDFAAVDVLSYILSTEPAGRLYKALVETKIASSIVGGTFALHDPGVMIFYSQATKKDNLTQVRDVMIAEIEKIGCYP